MPNQDSNPQLDERITQLESELAPTLRDFRRASVLFAEREAAGKLATRNWQTVSRTTASPRWQRWTIAAATCALILCGVFLRNFSTTTSRTASSSILTTTATETATLSDEALLETVATDLSTSVPKPLQTLAPAQSTSTATTVSQ